MKHLKLFLVLFLLPTMVSAADTLSSNINKATVFLSGAQVFRESKNFVVQKGVNEVIIKDVSPYLNQQHLQATAVAGDFRILDVQFVTEHVQPKVHQAGVISVEIQNEMDALQDSLVEINFELEFIRTKLGDLSSERQLIIKSKLTQISDTLPDFKQVMAYYRQKLDEINRLNDQFKRSENRIVVRQLKHKARLQELQTFSRNTQQPQPSPKQRYHIQISTYAERNVPGKIEVNYLVPNAGWVPSYDLRADNTTDPMEVTYKARVFQNTGEKWDNVDLILSTYNQNCFTTKPSIGIWRLDYIVNKRSATPQVFSQNFSSEVEMKKVKSGYESMGNADVDVSFMGNQTLSNISQNFSNVEFDVKLPYTIESNGQQKLMVISNETVPADYFHFLMPRANKNGFLQAKISNWETLSLLPGPANIYFNKTFVGQTRIDPSILSDTMEISLGRDQGIISSRKKISEEEKKVGIARRIQKIYEFEIEVKNASQSAVVLELEDLIPITNNEEIKIELIKAKGATFDENTGHLVWKMNLKPGEKQTVQFSYSIEHDKDKPIS